MDAEITQILTRLENYYEAFEKGTLTAENLEPRIATLKSQQSDLEVSRSRIQQTETASKVSEGVVRRHVEGLRELLQDAYQQQRTTALRSFIERIEVDGGTVTVEYHLPQTESRESDGPAVLPIVPFGGDGGTRTPGLCIANAALSQLSYIPVIPNERARETNQHARNSIQTSNRFFTVSTSSLCSVQLRPGSHAGVDFAQFCSAASRSNLRPPLL